MKPWAEAFYKSSAWKQVREAYIIYKHGICERCGGPGVIVHIWRWNHDRKMA